MAELLGLFLASFAAATLIPLPSEAALYGYLQLHPESTVLAVAIATLGNTAGGMTTYLIGRFLPEDSQSRINPKAIQRLKKYGAAVTVLAWLPVIGDALCAAAGWLRIKWWLALAFMATGRLARYMVVAYAA